MKTSTTMAMKTPSFMQDRFLQEATSRINLVGDIDDISDSSSGPAIITTSNIEQSKQASNPRVQVLRLASIARREERSIPGTTPPFQPAAPSLVRFDQEEESAPVSRARKPSHLRNLTLSNYSTSTKSRYDSETFNVLVSPSNIQQIK